MNLRMKKVAKYCLIIILLFILVQVTVLRENNTYTYYWDDVVSEYSKKCFGFPITLKEGNMVGVDGSRTIGGGRGTLFCFGLAVSTSNY